MTIDQYRAVSWALNTNRHIAHAALSNNATAVGIRPLPYQENHEFTLVVTVSATTEIDLDNFRYDLNNAALDVTIHRKIANGAVQTQEWHIRKQTTL